MVNSIAYFEENCIKELEKLEENFIKNPTQISEYIMSVNEVMHKLGVKAIQEALETLDQLIQESYLRKRDWVVESNNTKHLITSLGDVTFKWRACPFMMAYGVGHKFCFAKLVTSHGQAYVLS